MSFLSPAVAVVVMQTTFVILSEKKSLCASSEATTTHLYTRELALINILVYVVR